MNESTYYNFTDNNSTSNITEEVDNPFPDGGISTVLVINVFLFVVGFLIWNFFIRRKSKSEAQVEDDEYFEIDPYKDRQSDLLENIEFKTYVWWIWRLLRLSNDEVIMISGIDASIYLRLQRSIIRYFLFLSFFGLLVVLPANYYGGNERLFNGFDQTTIANVLPNSQLLWVHCGFTILVSIMSYLLVLWLTITYSRNSRHPARIDVRSFSIMINNFPEHLGGPNDEDALRTYLQNFYPDQIFQVYILVDVAKLNDLYHLQCREKELQLILQHYNEINALTRRRPQLDEENIWWRCYFIFKRIFGAHQEPITDAIDFFNHQLAQLQQKMKDIEADIHNEEMKQSSVNPRKGSGLAFVTFKSINTARRCKRDFQTSKPPPPQSRLLDEDVDDRDLVYRSLDISQWSVSKAPHPDDIKWESLAISRFNHFVRLCVINLTLFVLLFFFTTPLSLLAGLESFLQPIYQTQWVPSQLTTGTFNLDVVLESKTFDAFVIAFIPSIFLVALAFTIPLLLQETSYWEGHHTQSDLDRSSMRKICIFLLLSTLVLPTLMLTSISAAVDMFVESSNPAVVMMHQFSNLKINWGLFINFIIHATFLGGLIALYRPGIYLWKKWRLLHCHTDAQKNQVLQQKTTFTWGYSYAMNLLIFSTGLFFATFSPLILVFAALFFMIRMPIDKYNLLLVHVYTRSDFHIMRTIRRFLLTSICLYQVAVFCFLYFIKNANIPAGVVLVLFGVSILFFLMDVFGVFKPLSKKEKEEWTAAEDGIYQGPGEVLFEAFRDAYLHPAYKNSF